MAWWLGGDAHTATRSALPNNAYRILGLLIGHMDLATCEVHGQSAQRLVAEIGWSTRSVERVLATLRKTGGSLRTLIPRRIDLAGWCTLCGRRWLRQP